MRRSVARLLNARGFATEVFASAEEFLDRDPVDHLACVVLDIQLDGMTGIELSSHLKGTGCQVPVIFITAIEDGVLEQEAREVGCVAYLHKPFPADLLIGAIEKTLAGPRTD